MNRRNFIYAAAVASVGAVIPKAPLTSAHRSVTLSYDKKLHGIPMVSFRIYGTDAQGVKVSELITMSEEELLSGVTFTTHNDVKVLDGLSYAIASH